MNEIIITTGKAAKSAGQTLHIWGWEVPVYLFLGGLTAGVLVLSAIMILMKKGKKYPVTTNRIILLAPILISLGMVALFLDLSHKLYVWRFYTAFKITSVMSWGAWILLLVYPLSIALIMGTAREGFPRGYAWVEEKFKASPLGRFIDWFHKAIELAEKHKEKIAMATIPVGIFLGIYTGILLSAFGARPFWNSAILGPLFLISGVSTGAALTILLAKDHKEKMFLTKIDLGLLAGEFFLIILFLIGLLTSTAKHIDAAKLVLGGFMTPVFWIFIFGMGLSLPAFLEILELRGKKVPAALASSLVLLGGLLLRFIVVEAGQVSSWLPY